jgi:hypothetical protein
MDATRILEISDLWVSFPAYRSEPVRALKGIYLRIASGSSSACGRLGSARRRWPAPPWGWCRRQASSSVRVLFDGRDWRVSTTRPAALLP